MTPRTRASNQDAKFTVYYSKKVPQQTHFLHKRKTVRKPSAPLKGDGQDRQMRFLPEKMRREVRDSDEEMDDEVESEDEDVRSKSVDRRRKRQSDTFEGEAEESDIERPTPKRRQKVETSKSSHRPKIKREIEDDNHTTPASFASKAEKGSTLRRQATMTQLVEGRPLLSDEEEPEFKPVPRRSRLSWGGRSKKEKDKKQRTLTQMVPGMKAVEIVSDEDMEELSDAEDEGLAYNNAIAARLAQDGLIQNRSDDIEEPTRQNQKQPELPSRRDQQNGEIDVNVSSLPINSVENDEDEEEESYKPTQFIDAPVTRTKRNRGQTAVTKQPVPRGSISVVQSTDKSRFGLLSTPEKRRIREIPSSQSPPDTPLSQISPSKSRPPLRKCFGNASLGAETPSKRKQVKFQEPAKEQIAPPSLRKFRSVIQDSEDEGEDLLDDDAEEHGYEVSAHDEETHDSGNGRYEKTIGIETQAIIDQIDQACAHSDDEMGNEESQELDTLSVPQGRNEPSPELGDQLVHNNDTHEDEENVAVKQEPSQEADSINAVAAREPLEEAVMNVKSEPASADIELPTMSHDQVPSSPPIMQTEIEDTCPSTPIVLMDSSDEEDDSSPPQDTFMIEKPSLTNAQQSAGPNDESIQVPCSPPTQHETQQSHSSKAEQQLQNEWFSYSQYANTKPPQSSSMHVAHDKFSYDATPRPPHPTTQKHHSAHPTSQATTVDEVTPRKNRTQRFPTTANTTPHKIANSQPEISPSKPPPLFIPSSFPSPTKARMEEWSSPVLGPTQDLFGGAAFGYGASLEDFSIPLPPPREDD